MRGQSQGGARGRQRQGQKPRAEKGADALRGQHRDPAAQTEAQKDAEQAGRDPAAGERAREGQTHRAGQDSEIQAKRQTKPKQKTRTNKNRKQKSKPAVETQTPREKQGGSRLSPQNGNWGEAEGSVPSHTSILPRQKRNERQRFPRGVPGRASRVYAAGNSTHAPRPYPAAWGLARAWRPGPGLCPPAPPPPVPLITCPLHSVRKAWQACSWRSWGQQVLGRAHRPLVHGWFGSLWDPTAILAHTMTQFPHLYNGKQIPGPPLHRSHECQIEESQ